MEAAVPRRARKSATERREEIIAAAIRHFGVGGFAGTSTEAIARDAGISQPYLFRLFSTKRALFLACHQVMHERILACFRAAAHEVPVEHRLEAMGRAYIGLLEDRELLRFQMQSYAATADPEIRAQVRDRYGEVVREIARLTGAGTDELWHFCGSGMLLNVIASLELPAVGGKHDWLDLWRN